MWKYFLVLVWIAYMLACGVHLFSRGFLLSRLETNEHNTCIRLSLCDDVNNETCLNSKKADELIRNVNDSQKYCLPKKSKVILLVIDALKYDFGIYDTDVTEPKAYQNKLTIIHELQQKYPKNTRIGRFIADPPTTTLQRLKGITTGSLPTFIDVGSNFDTSEISEDNILDQIKRNNLSTVFMGDSTWTDLFPGRFKRQYPYPSFNIFDLDTVDNEIKKVLPTEIKNSDWDLLITHFLGVDHCGHRYNAMHSEMARKLSEMNRMIEFVAQEMDDETTLFVVGDHGMTGTGDHGGDSKDETEALLFAYSKVHEFYDDDKSTLNEMRQIDIVPTLAIILGIPIPFSNLGTVNMNLVPRVLDHPFNDGQLFLLHTWSNALQMRTYFSSYIHMSPGTFSDDSLDDQFRKFSIYSYRATTLYTNVALANFHKDLKLYLREVLEICRDIWVNFDAAQMCQGLLIIAVGAVLIYLLVASMKIEYFRGIFTANTIGTIFGGNLIAIGIGSVFSIDLGFRTAEHAIVLLSSIFNIAFLSILVTFHWYAISESLSKRERDCHIIPRAVFLLSISVFFSNSFIIEEQSMLGYILITLIVLLLTSIQRTNVRTDGKIKFNLNNAFSSNWMKMALATGIVIIIIRNSYSLFRCREEHGNCGDFNFTSSQPLDIGHTNEMYGKSSSNRKADIIPVIVLAFFVTLSKMFLRFSGSQTGYTPHVLMAKFSFVITALAVGGHFVLSQTPRHGIRQINIDALAWLAYASLLFHILLVIVDPLMVYVIKPNELNRVDYPNHVIPAVFNYLKKELEPSNKDSDDRPFVVGVTAVYSSVLISFSVTFALVLALLLGPNASIGLFVTILAAATITGLGVVGRYQTARSLENCLQPQYLTLVAWTLLAQFSFYATSHQPTLSQIEWHAAFIGRSAIYDHSTYLSAAMVLMNTFAGPILINFLYPMLIVMGANLHSRLLALVPKPVADSNRKFDDDNGGDDQSNVSIQKRNFEFNIGRGELVLFDNEEIFIGTVFKVGCQLFVLQALRVFCSMLACTIHARHLMVWKIFAPKFMFEGLSTYISFIAILLGMALVLRTHQALSRLIAKLS